MIWQIAGEQSHEDGRSGYRGFWEFFEIFSVIGY